MSNLKMFTFCLHSRYLKKIEALNYTPVGLGNNNFPPSCLRDNTGDNISNKNKYYSELTFHYWFWKNMIDKIDNDKWIGFSHYKYFWKNLNNNENQLNKNFLNKIPDSWDIYETILGEKIILNDIKFLKIIKNGGLAFLFDRRTYFKKNRNIEFHFEIFHGTDVINEALEFLDEENKKDFKTFLQENNSYHKWNMFICKSKKKMKSFYKLLFEWLLKCEKKFGFELQGYGKARIYGFLAERFMSYWFSKNTIYKEHPLFYCDLDKV